MKLAIVFVLVILSGLIYAATMDEDGNLVLSREEVMRADALWRETNRQLEYFRSKSTDLQKEVDILKSSKCS